MSTSLNCAPSMSSTSTAELSDRRRHPRYRYSTPITLRPPGGEPVPAITLEISESGLSALVGATFQVGDQLELEPIGGGKAAAIVRRSVGRLCGFEFLALNTDQVQRIRDRCKTLPIHMGGIVGV